MENVADIVGRTWSFVREALTETLWPTRCALCDVPGSVLCSRCERNLAYLDWWRACPRCGAAYGVVQCCACTPIMLSRLGRASFPFSACVSATMFDEGSGRIVRVFKDQGEQRLSQVMASAMAKSLPMSWAYDFVTFVPASLVAYRCRGFDHAALLAQDFAQLTGSKVHSTLSRPETRDQRKLTRYQRFQNTQGMFGVVEPVAQRRILLVDDVFTTGATACAATDALLDAGAADVKVITFARV